MVKYLVPFYISTITFFKFIALSHLTRHDGSHAFITNNAQYLNDEISDNLRQGIGNLQYFQQSNIFSERIKLRFEPNVLDFRERPLGIVHSETVTLFNMDNNKTVDLLSISGTTVHFHSSFFEDKKIPPNGNTSFRLVYLGRQEGQVESTLFIHTSIGPLKYNVKAIGTYSIYRLRPIVGIKVPINSTFTPTIDMYNPHSKKIQIVEIYTSGGGFHLELVSGKKQGPDDLWEISPHQSKQIIRVRFEAKVARNHTGYIRIKLREQTLIVPLEVEVTAQETLFHPQGFVDFGLGGTMDQPKEIKLCLFNPLKVAVRINSVSTLSKSIKTQYYGIRVPGTKNENKCVDIGTLTVDWNNAWKTQDFHGKIIVKFGNGQNRTEIPYYLTVFEGGITFNKMMTIYLINDNMIDATERKLEMFNDYNLPIRIIDVKYPSDVETVFKIKKLTPTIIKPAEQENIFNIRVRNRLKRHDVPFNSHIRVITNISDIRVPVLSYNGKIQIHLPYTETENILDLGLIGHNTKKPVFFVLTNKNPVHIEIVGVRTTLAMTDLKVKGCGVGDHQTAALPRGTFRNLTKCIAIPPFGYAVLKMAIVTTNVDRRVTGGIQIETPFEDISLNIRFRVAYGKFVISTDQLVFRNCFPYKLCEHLLIISSTFAEPMAIKGIVNLPSENKRLAKIPIEVTLSGNISFAQNKKIGQLHLRPEMDCSPFCYVGRPDKFMESMFRRNQSFADLRSLRVLFTRYLNFTNRNLNYSENVTLRIDTTHVKAQIFESKIEYVWPTLVQTDRMANEFILHFPVTHVGNTSYASLKIWNPSSQPVIIELVYATDYEEYKQIGSIFPLKYNLTSPTSKCFSFNRTQMSHERRAFFGLHNQLYRGYGRNHSVLTTLKPSAMKRIYLKFKAEKVGTYSNYLLLRNNLTVLEVIRVVGFGSIPKLIFTKVNSSDTSNPLFVFNFTNSFMEDCSNWEDMSSSSSKGKALNLTITQVYSMKNIDHLPITVKAFYINGYPCEGFGFKIGDCHSFELPPNESKLIYINFTTDLTASVVERTLQIITSSNKGFNYSLYAVIPRSYCIACEDLVQRPFWEAYLNKFLFIFLLCIFIAICVVATFEMLTITTNATDLYIASTAQPVLPVLDLRKIGNQVRDEIQSQAKDKRRKDEIASVQQPLNTHTLPIPSVPVRTINTTSGTASTITTITSTTSVTTVAATEGIVKIESAVVPTTGKAKKKLAQRNSIINDEENNGCDTSDDQLIRARNRDKQTKKDLQYERHRLKSRERKTEKELKLLEEKERKEKHSQQKESEERKKQRLLKQKLLKVSTATAVPSATITSTASTRSPNSQQDNQEIERPWMMEKKNQHHHQTKAKESFSSTSYYNEHKTKHVSFVNTPVYATKPPKYQDKPSELDRNFSSNKEKKRDFKLKERQEKLIFKNKMTALEKSVKPPSSEATQLLLFEKSKSLSTEHPTSTSTVTNTKLKEIAPNRGGAASSSTSGASRMEQASSSGSLTNKTESFLQTITNKKSPSTRNTMELLKSFPMPSQNIVEPMPLEPSLYNSIDLGPIGSKRLGTPGSTTDINISPTNKFKQEALLVNIKLLAKKKEKRKKSPAKEFNLMDDKSVIAAVSNNTIMSNSTNNFMAQGAQQNIQCTATTVNSSTAAIANSEDGILRNISPSNSKLWNQQQDLLKKPAPVTPETDIGLLTQDSDDEPWETPFAPNSETSWTNAFSNVLNSSTTWNNNSSYLWGLNPVWSWSPTHSSKKPPGFDKKEEKKEEKTQHLPTSYSLFDSGCSWAEKRDWDNKPDPNFPN